MLGGDQDYNHKKDMTPIASLVFAMKKEKGREDSEVQLCTEDNKREQRHGKDRQGTSSST